MNKPSVGTSYDDVSRNMQEAAKLLSHLGVPASVLGKTKKENWLQQKIALIRFLLRIRKH